MNSPRAHAQKYFFESTSYKYDPFPCDRHIGNLPYVGFTLLNLEIIDLAAVEELIDRRS